MAKLVAIVGDTGTGKSRSIKGLPVETTYLINVSDKELPYKGGDAIYTEENKNCLSKFKDNIDKTQEILSRLNTISSSEKASHIKQVVIDDFQYLMADELMFKAKDRSGNPFDKFTDIAQHIHGLLFNARRLRDDLIIYVLTHEETVDENFSPKIKMKTVGKMLDRQITLEGMFTIVLFTDVKRNQATKKSEYRFLTQNDGVRIAKSPEDLFPDLYIENDLGYVTEKIREYYKKN